LRSFTREESAFIVKFGRGKYSSEMWGGASSNFEPRQILREGIEGMERLAGGSPESEISSPIVHRRPPVNDNKGYSLQKEDKREKRVSNRRKK